MHCRVVKVCEAGRGIWALASRERRENLGPLDLDKAAGSSYLDPRETRFGPNFHLCPLIYTLD